jgi:adenylate kinase
MKIIFFGPPGSGKGTQAKLLAKELDLLHLSTGDILREKLSDRDTLSIKLKEIMSSGNLVSDEILNQIIANKLMSEECSNGYILDGYPRTISQSEFLLSFSKSNNLNLDKIFDFKIDFKIVEERIILRSKQEQRSDDNINVIKTRLDKYLEETYPVSQFFSNKFSQNFFTIDASKDVS